MKYSSIILFVIYIFFTNIVLALNYKAAVIDYSPIYQTGMVNRSEALSIMNQNLHQYEAYISESSSQNVDIILFPEDGLYGAYFYTRNEILPYLEYIPDVNPQNLTGIIPCTFNTIDKFKSPILVKSSCLAIKYNITIVLNMGEIRYCDKNIDSSCPNDNRYQYNTLIALSSSGELVAKYHKSHLYYEPQFNSPPVPDVVWFESDFGVKFGMLICFDLMFEEPQLSLYYKHGIRDFLWSSWWVNVPPLITGTQVELPRSLSLPCNYLASGIGLSWYNSGSGIYSYGKALNHWYNIGDHPINKLMINTLPIIDSKEEQNIFHLQSDRKTDNTLTATLPTINVFTITPGLNITIESQSNDLICSASIICNNDSYSGELFGVYSLKGIYNNLFPAEICALLRCYDSECVDSIMITKSTFDYFKISGNFNTDQLFMMYPMVATNNTLLANPDFYKYNSLPFPTSIESTTTMNNYSIVNAALFGLQHYV